jgi:acetyl-CoA synthetase
MGIEPPRNDESLERELAGMLGIERFDPPVGFVERAGLSDASVYESADDDWQGWWVSQAERLHWFERWDRVLDDSNPPFYKWFVGGKLNVSYNCLDRHVQAGIGERVAYHWHGEEGEELDITYADLLARTQKLRCF